MTLLIPFQPVPSQIVTCTLGGQSCAITVQQRGAALFVSLAVNDAPIINNVIAEPGNVIVRSVYLGFSGDLAIYDVQPGSTGDVNPFYQGLGSRFLLFYFAPSELPAGLA